MKHAMPSAAAGARAPSLRVAADPAASGGSARFRKRVDADQLGFKHEADPMGLLNPGKMKSFVPRAM